MSNGSEAISARERVHAATKTNHNGGAITNVGSGGHARAEPRERDEGEAIAPMAREGHLIRAQRFDNRAEPAQLEVMPPLPVIAEASAAAAGERAYRAGPDVKAGAGALRTPTKTEAQGSVHENSHDQPKQPGYWKRVGADLALASILPVTLLAAWQFAGSAGYVSSEFLPTPLAIGEQLARLLGSGELLHHLGVSIGRAFAGFAIGGMLGLLFGLLTGLLREAEYLLDPSVQLLRLVPHLAVAPLIILWFGFGEVSKIAIIAIGAFFPMYLNTYLGIRNADNKLFEVARVLEFRPLKRLTRLTIPSAAPHLLLGLRLSLAVSWIGLVVAELIGSRSGVGFLINEAKQNASTDIIFVGILLFAVVGKLIDSLVRLLERRWLRWRDSFQG